MLGYAYTPMRLAAMSDLPRAALSTDELRRRTGQLTRVEPLPIAGPVRPRIVRRDVVTALVLVSGLAVGVAALRRVRRRRRA